jgi:peptide/nickel transport system ATP-binding protein
MSAAFLEISELSIALRHHPTERLLRSVSLSVAPGEVRGLVGESGAGKTMIGKTIFDILPRAAMVIDGSVRLGGVELLSMRGVDRRKHIARTSALIPQDPLTAFNPVRRVEGQMTDRLTAILGLGRRQARERALNLLAEVHINDPERVLVSYPHQLSGGMRQRVLIAAAFAAEPKLIVADEPTTALDVTVQKQILRLIAEMQARHGTALLFVTHDLGVVAKICQKVTVLYGGRVVEDADAARLFASPQHPYSAALIAATPRYDRPEESLLPVPAEVIAATRREIAEADAMWAKRRA